MRLWSLHPKYLDSRGLVALWRESLLAQAVLKGQTRGYIHHPQLIRFRNSPSPVESIAFYLEAIHAEATRRGYSFDARKFAPIGSIAPLSLTQGQLDYEWGHLQAKMRLRAPLWLAGFESISHPEPHPLFRIVPGKVAEWEITHPKKTLPRTR
jgi:hypothetical protein